tara:strand:+ start:1639 stop:1986 length:348 start_codon:yes stop_codon:yes gene_type:complete
MEDKQRQGHINRQKGKRKQAMVRRTLEAIYGVQVNWTQHKSEEENWIHLPVGIEVKAGKQVGPIHTRYKNARAQHEKSVPNDTRPFLFVACPDGDSDAYVIVRLSEFESLLKETL